MTKNDETSASSRNDGLIALALGVIASVIASAIFAGLQVLSVSWAFVIVFGVATIAEAFAIIRIRHIPDSEPPTRAIGIIAVAKNKNVSLEEIIESASHSIYFWGISGKRTISNPAFRESILRVAKSDGDVRFLLTSPSSTVLRLRAQEERESVDAWVKDIEGTAERFRQLAEREQVPLHIRFSAEYPIWRMIIIDRRYLYVHWFLPDKQGPQSPELILEYTGDGLARPLLRLFEETWKRCDANG